MSSRILILALLLASFFASTVDAQLFRRFRAQRPAQQPVYQAVQQPYQTFQHRYAVQPMQRETVMMDQYSPRELTQRQQAWTQSQTPRESMSPGRQQVYQYYYRPNCRQQATNNDYAQSYYRPNVGPNVVTVVPRSQVRPYYVVPQPFGQSMVQPAVALTPGPTTLEPTRAASEPVLSDPSVAEASFDDLGVVDEVSSENANDVSIIEPFNVEESAPSMEPANEEVQADEIPIEGAGSDDFSILENDG